MAATSSFNMTTLKRGWLTIQRPDKKNPKDYFVLLRTETLECYSNAAEAERASRRSNLQLQLRNCILIQSLKKEKVKHGFSLLIVPDGMYVMSAVSETEKTSWLNEIRDTIACQVKGDMEMMNEPMNPGTERKRKKSFSGSNEKSGHRLRLHRNRKKDTSSSVDDLERFNSTSDLDSSTFQQFRNLRSNSPHLGAKITNSVISLQDRRSRGSDFVTGGSRVNMQPSSVDLRSGHRRSEPTENEARKLIQSPQIQRPGSTSRGWNNVPPVNPVERKDTWGSEYSITDSRIQSTSGQRFRASVSSDQVSIQNTAQPTSGRHSARLNDDRPPEPKRPLVWSITDQSHTAARSTPNRSSHTTPPQNLLNGGSPILLNRSPTPKQMQSRQSVNPNNSVVAITQPGSRNSKRESPSTADPAPKPAPTITILHANDSQDRSSTAMTDARRTKSTLEPLFVPPVEKANVTQPTNNSNTASNLQPSQWKNTGVSPSSQPFTGDRKRASFYTVKRRDLKDGESNIRSISVYRDSAQPVTRTNSQDSLYVENQKLREQIRALTTTNYELEAKINFYGQRANPEKQNTSKLSGSRVEQLRSNAARESHQLEDLREILIPVDRKRSASVEPGIVTPDQRVESWLMASPIAVNDPIPKDLRWPNARKKHAKSRRNTTGDIPSPENIYAMVTTDASGPMNGPRVQIDRTQMRSPNVHEGLQKNILSASAGVNVFSLNNDSPLLSKTKSNFTNERTPSRMLTPNLPEPIDPRYASSMWCRLVDLWSNLLNEERAFWKIQLQHLFSESLKRQFVQDPNDLLEVLDKANRQHTEETVALWKHIYESWIPRDYLDYFSAETRKIMVCLHSVIDSLFTMVNEICSGQDWDGDVTQRLNNLQQRMVQARAIDGIGMANDPDVTPTTKSPSYGLFRESDKRPQATGAPLLSHMPADNWQQIKLLLKESHSELLEQVYNVAELVGAALDAEMEDNIRSAKARGEHDIDPLTSLPPSGLQAAAKLQSVVLDLESRLEAVDLPQEYSVDQPRSQPLVPTFHPMNAESIHAVSESGPRLMNGQAAKYNIKVEGQVNGAGKVNSDEDDDDDDEDTYTGLNSNMSGHSQEKPPFTILTATKAPNGNSDKNGAPVIWVIQDNRENELYHQNAEVIDPRWSSSYPESEVISIGTTRHDGQPELYDWRLRKQ